MRTLQFIFSIYMVYCINGDNSTTNSCYRFGDCIDQEQNEGIFHVGRIRDITQDTGTIIHHLLLNIEQKLNITSEKNIPHPNKHIQMCIPTDEDAQYPYFIRKMYTAYRIADMANQAYLDLEDFLTEIMERLRNIKNNI